MPANRKVMSPPTDPPVAHEEKIRELVDALGPLLDNADGYDKSWVRGAFLAFFDKDLDNPLRQEKLDDEERARLAWKAPAKGDLNCLIPPWPTRRYKLS